MRLIVREHLPGARFAAATACLLAASACLIAADAARPALPGNQPKTAAEKAAAEKGSHQQQASIPVRGSDGKATLQALSVDPKGRVLALVAPSRSFGAPVQNGFGEVHVFSPEGKKISTWKVKFHAHSINAGPDGTVYVAGDGKVAKFDPQGKALGEIELPHVKKLLANSSSRPACAAVE